jgi:hypothetical protein
MIHDVETLRRPRSEKDSEENVQELVGELEEALNKN